MAKRTLLSKKRRSPPKPSLAAADTKARSPGDFSPAAAIGPPAAKPFPIVGIGASAGGLAAFEAFLSAMPFITEKPMAFVLVQHLSPDHKSLLTELVKRYTRMHVHEVQNGMDVNPGHVYIIPPNCDMALLAGKLHLFPPIGERGSRLSIDFFFRSLAADQRESSVCIVLSGTGSDGSMGLRAVKAAGGMVIAQSPESTEFDGMPRSAIATGLVDYVLSPAQMPARLITYSKQAFDGRPRAEGAPTAALREIMAKVCVLLRAATGHDFSQYKENTIVRRIQRRMALHQVENPGDYLRYIQNNAEEAQSLFRDMLIGVTSFFRDTDAFEALQNIGIPRLFDGVLPGGPVRVWVCGSSTGDEAYSIAILIQEHIETLQRGFKVQIFATDIDRDATRQAREGLFPASISTAVSTDRLARHFDLDANGCYRIRKVIRDSIVFSDQDVLKDPPFSKLGLISCRNLLIYLNGDIQKRLITLFHYSLQPGGMLFLGNSETVGDQPGQFEALDRKAKLYLRKGDSGHGPEFRMGKLLTRKAGTSPPSPAAAESRGETKLNLRELTEQAVLRDAVKACVLVKGNGDILYYHGRTGNYLEPSPGDAASNVRSMSREGLRRDLTSALMSAGVYNEPAYARNLRVKASSHDIMVDLAVIPVPDSETFANLRLFLVVFEERPMPKSAAGSKQRGKTSDISASLARIETLERELQASEDYLQTVIEEMKTSSEELKSSNEEMQSVNEELQSTNEELETSKEELQSVNEELATVNAELQQKVADLSRVNSDMKNLLAGTGVGTLFVDPQLRISRFTPTITKVINLIATDIGRPLAHTVTNFLGYECLISDIESVLDTLIPVEKEVEAKAGGWYLLGIRPYRTLDNVIDGAVITFVDITALKVADHKLRAIERFRSAAEIETVGIVFFNLDGAITSANNAFLRMSGNQRVALDAGKLHWHQISDASEQPNFQKALEELKKVGFAGQRQRIYLHQDGSRHLAIFTARRISEGEAVGYLIDIPDDLAPSA